MNPFAVIFWLICALIGWLVGDIRGAVIGLVGALCTSLFITVLEEWRK